MTPLDDLRRVLLANAFRMPSYQTMVSRKSSITNAFVNTLIPIVVPTHEEIEAALQVLGMDPADVRCAYCGNAMTEWDHLRPLVKNHRPTGYISEIANLVPSCPKCNQSKGNSAWRNWIVSKTATHSPTKRNIVDLSERIARLEDYEKWRTPITIPFDEILTKEELDAYWSSWEQVNAQLRRIQEIANIHRKKIDDWLQEKLSRQ